MSVGFETLYMIEYLTNLIFKISVLGKQTLFAIHISFVQ